MSANDTQVQVRDTYERRYSAGSVVFEEGAEGEAVYVIQAGEIEISKLASGGRNVVARLGPGEFFGEMGVILGERRTAQAVALSETRLLELDGPTLEAMCVERPEIAIRIIRRMTARLIEAERRLSALGIDDMLRPLVRALVQLAEKDPSGSGVRIETSLRRLAGESGLTLREAHQGLHRLFDRKAIRLVDDVLTAPDLDGITACLEASP